MQRLSTAGRGIAANMERWQGRVALVTGASAGIGYCVAKALVEKGMKVVACARNVAAVEKLQKEVSGQPGSVTAVKCDVSKEEDVKAMFHTIRQNKGLGRVDVCINNAGLSHSEPLLTGDPAKWRHVFEVNVLGLMMVTKEAVKLMQENKIDDGHIILVNSMAGLKTMKTKEFHCYSATKFAVTAIKEGLRHELRELNSHIRVSQVYPGTVQTDFLNRLGDEKMAAMAASAFSSVKCLQTEDIKDAILYMLEAPPHVEVTDAVVLPTEEVW